MIEQSARAGTLRTLIARVRELVDFVNQFQWRRPASLVSLATLSACAGMPTIGLKPETVQVAGTIYTRAETTSVFAPGVISNGEVFASSFTPDGRTVYFTRATQDRSKMQIMRSSWRGDGWTNPVIAPFSTGARQMDPHVSPNGKLLYFTAPRRREAASTEPDGDWDTWVAKLDGEGDATRLTSLANSAENEMYPSVTVDSTVFFGVRKRNAAAGTPGEIMYIYKQTRTTPVPVPLREVTNPGNPYITPDGRVLIFSAGGPNPKSRTDLWVVTRGGDGRWSAPRNLGREVNTDEVEFCPQLSPDGMHLFFSRVHYDGDRATGNDIYVVPVRSVPVLRAALQGR